MNSLNKNYIHNKFVFGGGLHQACVYTKSRSTTLNPVDPVGRSG